MKLVVSNYQGLDVSFSEEGWFNATIAAEKFGKRVDNWLRLDETKEYIAVLNDSNPSDVRYLKTKRGNNGGTWLHPDLAVAFARWLDLLAKLEEKDAVLLASGLSYESRKASLLLFAAQLRKGGQLCAA